jgi:hypothetical protein
MSSIIAVAVFGAVAVTVTFGAVRFWALYTCWTSDAIWSASCIKSAKENAAVCGAGVAAPAAGKLP